MHMFDSINLHKLSGPNSSSLSDLSCSTKLYLENSMQRASIVFEEVVSLFPPLLAIQNVHPQ